MKFNRLGAFTLGVVITAVSVGAVSFVNAAGDATLKACANKKTGVMRYISKGSCNKKTETSLSWNQMGRQGLSGAAGLAGSNGTKGDTGTAGINGTDGKSWNVVDSTGKVLGDYVSYVPSQTTGGTSNSSWFVFLRDGLIFQAKTTQEEFKSTGGTMGQYYSGTLISPQPLAWTGVSGTQQETLVFFNSVSPLLSNLNGIYRTIGEPNLFTGAEIFNSFGRLLTADESSTQDSQGRWMQVQKIVTPAYTAPLKLVAK